MDCHVFFSGISSLVLPPLKSFILNTSKTYYATHEEKIFSDDERQMITFSYNGKIQTITGVIEEKGDFIYLYEYRGKYVGIEFFISFSKQSDTYKIIKVNALAA